MCFYIVRCALAFQLQIYMSVFIPYARILDSILGCNLSTSYVAEVKEEALKTQKMWQTCGNKVTLS